jgi:hypothetical protein
MPTFIKAGFWEKAKKGYDKWLDLDNLIRNIVGNSSYSREIIPAFSIPNLNDTISITPSKIDTIVTFQGPLTNNFTLNVDTSLSLPGNRIYLFVDGLCTITFTGGIEVATCGGSGNVYSVHSAVCLEEIYNGNNFIGIDNC